MNPLFDWSPGSDSVDVYIAFPQISYDPNKRLAGVNATRFLKEPATNRSGCTLICNLGKSLVGRRSSNLLPALRGVERVPRDERYAEVTLLFDDACENVTGRSFELAVALADRLARRNVVAPLRQRRVIATGAIDISSRRPHVTAVQHVVEKAKVAVDWLRPGDFFIGPACSPASERLDAETLLKARGIESLWVNTLDELDSIFCELAIRQQSHTLPRFRNPAPPIAASTPAKGLSQYSQVLKQCLNGLDSLFGRPISAYSLGLFVTLSVIYSTLCFSVAWTLGAPGSLGNVEITPDYPFPIRVLVSLWGSIFIIGLFQIMINARLLRLAMYQWMSRHSVGAISQRIAVFVLLMFTIFSIMHSLASDSLPVLALFMIAIHLLIYGRWFAITYWLSLALASSLLLLPALQHFYSPHFFYSFVAAIALSGSMGFFLCWWFRFAHPLTIALSLAAIIVTTVLWAWAFDPAITGIAIIGNAVGLLIPLVLRRTTVKEPRTLLGFMGPMLASYAICFAVSMYAAQAMVIAAASWVLFFVLLPFANAATDWLSWIVSRLLMKEILRKLRGKHRPWQQWIAVASHFVFDAFLATALMATVALLYGFMIEMHNQFNVACFAFEPFHLEPYITAASADPLGAGLWVTLMVITTLVPTAVHATVALASALTVTLVHGFSFDMGATAHSQRIHDWRSSGTRHSILLIVSFGLVVLAASWVLSRLDAAVYLAFLARLGVESAWTLTHCSF